MSMRETIEARVASLNERHEGLRQRRFGFLVAPGTIIFGWVVLVFGLVTIPFPGPGWLTVFLGVGIISLEQEWARRLLGVGVTGYDRLSSWYHRQGKGMRAGVVGTLGAVIVLTFAGLFFGAWSLGWADFATPVMAWAGVAQL